MAASLQVTLAWVLKGAVTRLKGSLICTPQGEGVLVLGTQRACQESDSERTAADDIVQAAWGT